MNSGVLVAGVFAVGVLVRGLANGSGSAGGHAIRRDEEPVAYWSVMTALTAISGFLLYMGFAT